MPCPKLSNPINPTAEDLRLWAYTPDADYPDEMSQDWDLCVTSFERAPLLVQFASDPDCPNRKFLLSCLYILAGDSVRDPDDRSDVPRIQEILRLVAPDAPPDVLRWVQRTERLLARPETYDYNRWGWGYFAYDDSTD